MPKRVSLRRKSHWGPWSSCESSLIELSIDVTAIVYSLGFSLIGFFSGSLVIGSFLNPQGRSNHRRCSVQKLFLENSQDSQESTCARVSFLINSMKKETLAQVFSCEFCNISKIRTPFLQSTSGRLLLSVIRVFFRVRSNRFFCHQFLDWYVIKFSINIKYRSSHRCCCLGLQLQKTQHPTEVFSCKHCKIFKSTYFEKHLRTAASDSSCTLHKKLNKIVQDQIGRLFHFET